LQTFENLNSSVATGTETGRKAFEVDPAYRVEDRRYGLLNDVSLLAIAA
jgi:hypothetical protein